jgi:D-arabinose 1-dehydrogenase-like Zn-dependent alcohol dehydrogenase
MHECGFEQAAADTLDGILDTVPKAHPIQPLINLLKFEGTLVMFGTPPTPYELSVSPLIQGKNIVDFSLSLSLFFSSLPLCHSSSSFGLLVSICFFKFVIV